jgi:hypothetical protein
VAKGQDGSVSAIEVDGGLASGRIPVQATLASLDAAISTWGSRVLAR